MSRFQGVAEQLGAELGRREVILDGEVVAIDDEGRINFWNLMRGEGTLAYAAFDVLWLNGRISATFRSPSATSASSGSSGRQSAR